MEDAGMLPADSDEMLSGPRQTRRRLAHTI